MEYVLSGVRSYSRRKERGEQVSKHRVVDENQGEVVLKGQLGVKEVLLQ